MAFIKNILLTFRTYCIAPATGPDEASRSGDRVAEGARLESGCTLRRGTEGSNPSHSAADRTEEESRGRGCAISPPKAKKYPLLLAIRAPGGDL